MPGLFFDELTVGQVFKRRSSVSTPIIPRRYYPSGNRGSGITREQLPAESWDRHVFAPRLVPKRRVGGAMQAQRPATEASAARRMSGKVADAN
jgi:hypothetical protein